MLTIQQYAKGATIPQNFQNNARLTISIVNEIFDAFPNQFTFNSGYRTPAHNAAVGGVANSFHVQALAADITPRNGNYDKYKSALAALVGKYGWEVIDERNKNHFHLEPSSGKAATVSNSQSQNNQSSQLPAYLYPQQTSSTNESLVNTQDKTLMIGFGLFVLFLLLRD